MKLHFFKEDALEYFESNIESNISHYSDANNAWVFEQFDEPFEEIEINCEPLKLYINSEEPTKMDLENIKIVYPALKDLTESQASDPRLWTGLIHSDFFQYAQARWNQPKEKNNMTKENYIRSRYFYTQDSKSKHRHTVAKLWWIGKLLYDENMPENPLHFVDTIGRKDMSTRVNDIFTSSFSRNIHLLRPFLNVIDYYELNGRILNQDYFRSLVQYLNVMGGLYLIDFLDEKDIELKLKKRVEYYDKFGPDVVKDIKKKRVNINSKIRVFSKNKNKRYIMIMDDKNIVYFLGKKKDDVVQYNNDELTIKLIF